MKKFCQTFFQLFISKSYFLLNRSKMKHFDLLFLLYLSHCLSSDPVKKKTRLPALAARGKIFVYKMRSFVISVQIPCGSFPDNYTA